MAHRLVQAQEESRPKAIEVLYLLNCELILNSIQDLTKKVLNNAVNYVDPPTWIWLSPNDTCNAYTEKTREQSITSRSFSLNGKMFRQGLFSKEALDIRHHIYHKCTY